MSSSYDDQEEVDDFSGFAEIGANALRHMSKRHRMINSYIGDSGTSDTEPYEYRGSDALSYNISANDTELDRKQVQHGQVAAVFLQKTFVMINECDPNICSWSDDGERFIVKDPDLLARDVIPKYFGHNKFASFSRQLNFYGFRKMQSKPIRNIDMDPETAKYLIFVNENFKRGREDLLVRIQRSTRGASTNTPNNAAITVDQDSEVKRLKQKVELLEEQMKEMSEEFKRKFLNLETSFASILQISTRHIQQQQQQQHQLLMRTQIPSNSLPPGTAHYQPNGQSTHMPTMEIDTKGATKEPTRQISYFGDYGHFDEIEFQDFFI